MSEGLDPEHCPHCGVSWVGDPVPDRSQYDGSHFTKNVVLMLDEPKYYLHRVQCEDAARHLESRLQARISCPRLHERVR